jgi:hypothetical protein
VTLGTSFHRYTRSFAVPFLSRLARSRGLVALRQTLVRRCHHGLGSSRARRKSANQNMTAVRRSLANRLLSGPSPVQDLLLCAKHLFVAAMVAGVHRACRESANQAMTAGRPRLEPVKCSGAAKRSAAAIPPAGRFAPCPEICYSAPKICSWQPWCQLCPLPGRAVGQM